MRREDAIEEAKRAAREANTSILIGRDGLGPEHGSRMKWTDDEEEGPFFFGPAKAFHILYPFAIPAVEVLPSGCAEWLVEEARTDAGIIVDLVPIDEIGVDGISRLMEIARSRPEAVAHEVSFPNGRIFVAIAGGNWPAEEIEAGAFAWASQHFGIAVPVERQEGVKL